MMIVEKIDPKKLKNVKKPFIIACDGCAKICGVGGEKGAKELAEKLNCGYKVIPRCCSEKIVKMFMKGIPKDKTLIVLACGAGFPFLKKLGYKVVAGAKTVGVGGMDEKGKLVIFRKLS